MTRTKGTPWSSRLGLSVGVTSPPRKKNLCSKNLRDASDGINRRRPGYREGHKIEVVRRFKYLGTVQLLGITGWRRRAANRDEWRRLMREAKARKGL